MTAARLAADVLVLSVQIACVIATAGMLALVVRVDAPAVRYPYWRALLVFCLVLPCLQRRQVAAPAVEAVAAVFPAPSAAVAPAANIATDATGVSWVQVAMWIVLTGIVLQLARLGYGLVRLRRFRRSGRVAPVSAERDELQGALGTGAEIRYVSSDGQPVTCGVWRPVVLLPERLTSQPPEIQRAVLVHELLHVQRRDWMWAMGEEVLRAVLWFHPGIWWLVTRVRFAREEAVDELAVCATGQRRAYLEALLAFADAAPFATGAAFGRRRHLFRRMMLISKEAVMSSRRIVVSCAVLVCGVAAGSWYAVDAFPLMQAPGVIRPPAQPPAAGEPGPLERSAKAITPENPIPRRTYSVTPKNPGDANAAMTAVTLRVTLNALGRVAEARPLSRLPGGNGNATPSDIFVKAALDAVRQWVYEPPADAPMSFDVTFVFPPGSEARLIAHGGPLGAGGGAVGGATDGVIGGGAPPPPPPPPPAPWIREGVTNTVAPVRVGGNIRPPTKVKDVRPVYSPMAQSARVQGVVILEVVIGQDGRVSEARVLRSIPLLDQAAIDAVKEWEFTPTTLNGAPVPVIMTVTVNFSLQ